MVSTQGPIEWKTFLNNDAGKMSSEQEDAFVALTIFSSSDSETGKKHSKTTGRAGVGTDNADADGDNFFLTLLIFSRKKEKNVFIRRNNGSRWSRSNNISNSVK